MVLVVKESQPSSAVSHNVIVILTVRFLTLEIPPPLLMVRRSIPEKLCHCLLHAIRDREIETDWAKSRVAQGILGKIVPEKLDSIEKTRRNHQFAARSAARPSSPIECCLCGVASSLGRPMSSKCSVIKASNSACDRGVPLLDSARWSCRPNVRCWGPRLSRFHSQ